MSALLSVEALNWQVNNKNILRDISFNVNKGEIFGIIGPNGAGKTSLLNCILNHQKGFTGTVKFKAKNVRQYNAKQLAQHFAVVAQKTVPIFQLSVYDVVRMGLLPHKSMFALDSSYDHRQILLALEKVGLSDLKNNQYNQLSGGEQQRVLIARALVQKAQVLILDEPTNHLDVYYQHQILQLIRSLNITVIMTIHDLNLAAQYCQRLLLLDQGKIIANDITNNVLEPKQLSQVFKLNCLREQTPNSSFPRVYFQLASDTGSGEKVND